MEGLGAATVCLKSFSTKLLSFLTPACPAAPGVAEPSLGAFWALRLVNEGLLAPVGPLPSRGRRLLAEGAPPPGLGMAEVLALVGVTAAPAPLGLVSFAAEIEDVDEALEAGLESSPSATTSIWVWRTNMPGNKNRLCSKTCGIDTIFKYRKIPLIRKQGIPPRREIWMGRWVKTHLFKHI